MAVIMRRERYQVVVVGGGPAGVCAAIASARAGRTTLLIEKYGFLGGMASAAMFSPWKGVLPQEPSHSQSIGAEIAAALKANGGTRTIPHGQSYFIMFDPEILKLCLQETVLNAEVGLLLHTHLIQASCSRTRVTSVIVQCREGAVEVGADVFIDATGNGDLAASCQEPYVLSNDPVNYRFSMLNVDHDALSEFLDTHPGSFARCESQWRASSRLLHPKTAIEIVQGVTRSTAVVDMIAVSGEQILTIDALSRAEMDVQRLMPEAELFLRSNIPGFAEAARGTSAAQIGFHSTRFFESDLVPGSGGAVIPVALPDSQDETTTIAVDSMRSRRHTNLLLTGRMLLPPSLLYSTNNQPASMALGEAAGLIAASL